MLQQRESEACESPESYQLRLTFDISPKSRFTSLYMVDSLVSSVGDLDINGSDTALDLALCLSELESQDQEPNAADLAEELQSLAAIYDTAGPSLSLYRAPPTARRPSPPPLWNPSSPDPLRLLLSTTLAPPYEEVPVHLLLSIPYPSYPTEAPPLIQLHDRYLSAFAVDDALFGTVVRTFIHDADAGIARGVEWTGGVCLFEGVELVKEICSEWVADQEAQKQRGEELRQEAAGASEEVDDVNENGRAEEEEANDEEERIQESSFSRIRRKAPADDVPCPEIYSAEGLVDRKSVSVTLQIKGSETFADFG